MGRRRKREDPRKGRLRFVESPVDSGQPSVSRVSCVDNPVTAVAVSVGPDTSTSWVLPEFSETQGSHGRRRQARRRHGKTTKQPASSLYKENSRSGGTHVQTRARKFRALNFVGDAGESSAANRGTEAKDRCACGRDSQRGAEKVKALRGGCACQSGGGTRAAAAASRRSSRPFTRLSTPRSDAETPDVEEGEGQSSLLHEVDGNQKGASNSGILRSPPEASGQSRSGPRTDSGWPLPQVTLFPDSPSEENVLHEPFHDASHRRSHDVSHRNFLDASHRRSQRISSHRRSQDASFRRSQSHNVSHRDSRDVSHRHSQDAPQRCSRRISHRRSQDVSLRCSQDSLRHGKILVPDTPESEYHLTVRERRKMRVRDDSDVRYTKTTV